MSNNKEGAAKIRPLVPLTIALVLGAVWGLWSYSDGSDPREAVAAGVRAFGYVAGGLCCVLPIALWSAAIAIGVLAAHADRPRRRY